MHEKVGLRLFAWQEAYGAFTIGVSQMDATKNYIQNQKAHHRMLGFDREFGLILKRHGIVPIQD